MVYDYFSRILLSWHASCNVLVIQRALRLTSWKPEKTFWKGLDKPTAMLHKGLAFERDFSSHSPSGFHIGAIGLGVNETDHWQFGQIEGVGEGLTGFIS